MKIKNIDDLKPLEAEGLKLISPDRPKITVGMATCGLASGAQKVFDAIKEEIEASKANIILASTACIGFCQRDPIVEVYMPGKWRVEYVDISPEKGREIVSLTAKGEIKKEWVLCTVEGSIKGIPPMKEIPFYKKQLKIVTKNCGLINPESIAEYVARGGCRPLLKVLKMKPEDVIDEISRSGLRGRGGAGFPTGRKWAFARGAKGDQKYMICNGDEGDPGAYMNREEVEGDPFSVLEGMIIAAYAIGATQGFIYIRDEYPLAIEKFTKAMDTAREYGLLGKNICDSGFDFDVRITIGAGAFVCGEETSLISSIEGKLPNPYPRPPYPAISGLFGKPTIINNVESLINVTRIFERENGAEWFSSIGSKTAKGTKVFSVVGKLVNTGLVEIPMGATLRELVFDIGGGIIGGKKFKAIQTGGPSGGMIPEQYLDTPVDYEHLEALGSIMGSGGMVVMDEDTCMIDVARFFFDFLKGESCGKCAPCREGIKQGTYLMDKICHFEGEEGNIETLEELAYTIKDFSLCALGGTAPNPLLTSIKYFRDEFEEHIRDKKCSAGVCKPRKE